ncbi:Aspartate--tRNA ligase, mitochondrial [Cyphellophora attinorum]|uniref:Aspartate--tRNA ligase, mitochondrial n=1 Tax=Cyphellophora attinorum TaxID=1664694 RepID=A0A0N0NRX2_9EURO|nr:Aspartate--tRNA ligase, mitochondrial [Phialophora attinorum]KPI45588.1 Aspartate--tRNA ligase, mitochondrial [Phialophora attinorum]
MSYSIQAVFEPGTESSPEPDDNGTGSPLSQDQKHTERMKELSNIRPHTPVSLAGYLRQRKYPQKVQKVAVPDPYVGQVEYINDYELVVEQFQPLNTVPQGLVAKHGFDFGPEQRHLHFRTDHRLRDNLRQRSRALALFRKVLFVLGFDEIETPLLFKSTSEGAREFIVPTRSKGMAYALPQSPQQYKQLLMASGVVRYFQFAKCFRDEDLRSDRQPEFTQLDLEMAFSGPAQVRNVITVLINRIAESWNLTWPLDHPPIRRPYADGEGRDDSTDEGISDDTNGNPRTIKHKDAAKGNARKTNRTDNEDRLPLLGKPTHNIPSLSYDEAMCYHGSDKPDLRIKGTIHRVEDWIPQSLKGMMTSLQEPIVEAFALRLKHPRAAKGTGGPEVSEEFIRDFMDSPAGLRYSQNPDGMPGIAVINPRKPLEGLAAFGHEAAEKFVEALHLRAGDILVLQSRPNARVRGGSTILGDLRKDLFHAAIAADVHEVDKNIIAPFGLCSTHHPFTSPVPGQDLDKLATAPLDVVGDHFDLVINGIEVGGGSRRIHQASAQEYILRDILKLPEGKINEFSHLLKALGDGCPPHTGFAFGFDRLMTILTRTATIRDVIAFPKSGSGEDRFVGSPSPMTREQLETYHLSVAPDSSATEVTAEPTAGSDIKISQKA